MITRVKEMAKRNVKYYLSLDEMSAFSEGSNLYKNLNHCLFQGIGKYIG